jgi:hypothetical protein
VNLDELVRHLDASEMATVLIDGRSGSGKSTLADRLQQRWAGSVVVRLDDIYPGWDGLAWAVNHVHTELLYPRSAGGPARWRQWDWSTNAPAGWRPVEGAQRLIVEGVGSLSAGNRKLADVGIWIDADDEVRKQRALTRDGDTYRPYWDRWAAQEETLMARHHPRAAADYLATETADGADWLFTSTHPG